MPPSVGELIFQLNSSKGQRDFPLAWLITLVTENCAQWQKVLQGAMETAVVVIVLDRLWLRSNQHWLESTMVTLSVQATLYLRGGGSAPQGKDARVTSLQRARVFAQYKAYVREP